MSEVSDQTKDDQVSDEIVDPKTKDSVKYDTFQRVLRQKKSLEEKLSAYEKTLEEIKMKDEADQQESLKKQQKFEELSKDLESKLEHERKEKETFKKSWLDTHKLQAVLDKLPSKPKRQEYLSFIDIDKIEIDPETGIVAESVEEVANSFLENYGDLLQKSGKNLPSDAPSSKQKLTHEAWLKLPLSEKKTRLKDVI